MKKKVSRSSKYNMARMNVGTRINQLHREEKAELAEQVAEINSANQQENVKAEEVVEKNEEVKVKDYFIEEFKEDKTCLIDTSSINIPKIFQVLKQFPKVALSLDVLVEMDRVYKDEKSSEEKKYNIRQLLKACAFDKNSDYYEVLDLSEYQKDNYSDNTLLNFLKEHKEEYCLLTDDYDFACRAKGYKVKYYLAAEFKDLETEDSSERNKIVSLSNQFAFLSGGKLFLRAIKCFNIVVMVFEQKGNQLIEKMPNSESIVQLLENDIVYFIKYNKEKKCANISKYLVIDIESVDGNAEYVKCDKVTTNEDIRKLHYNSALEKEAMEYLRKAKITFG